MALLIPTLQHFYDIPGLPGSVIGVSRVKLLTSSDTLTVPAPASSTASASVGRVLQAGQAAATVTQSGNTVTISGTAGNEVFVVTLHQALNFDAES
jgi:hypothetical protein